MAALMRPTLMSLLPAAALVACVSLSGCEKPVPAGFERVRIAGEDFDLEVADQGAKRFRGLSERASIPPDGGMLFVFPYPIAGMNGFVMRDCPVPIDILYLDSGTRVVGMFEMKVDPRRPDEGKPGMSEQEIAKSEGAMRYEQRLEKYAPLTTYQYVIELAGGTLPRLQARGLKKGDKVFFDHERLKSQAR